MRRSGFAVMARLVGMVRPLAGYMALAVVAGTLGHLCASAVTVGGVWLLMDALSRGTVAVGAAAVLAVCAVARGALRYAEQTCNHYIAFRLLALVRDRVFGALRALAPAKLAGRHAGELIGIVTGDIELLEVFFAHTISPVAIAVVYGAVVCGWLGSMHPALALAACASYVLVGAVVPAVTSRMAGDSGMAYREALGRMGSYALDSVRGLDVVCGMGAGEARLAGIGRATDDLIDTAARQSRAAGRGSGLSAAAVVLCDTGMLLLAASLYLDGVLQAEHAVLAVASLVSGFGPVMALANLGSTLQGTFAAGNRVLDILDEEPVVREVVGTGVEPAGDVRFEGVRFGYGDDTVLEGVDLGVPAGSIVGLCGASGSGKSTCLHLLMRWFEPDAGTVSVAGTTVGEISSARLRAMQSPMDQATFLYRDTIRENLLVAKPDASDDDLWDALDRAALGAWVRGLEHGLDTQVGELGSALSGGQRQRLGLARAFVHDGDMLLLDEPTANLDALSEAEVLMSLDRERRGKTVVLVSHRASTLRVCDAVYDVEKGSVV